jgi:exopolysaccharide biosynthesis polyprenyl glycosylphosphotransferase
MQHAHNTPKAATTLIVDGLVLCVLWLALTLLRVGLRTPWAQDMIPGTTALHDLSVKMHTALLLAILPVWLACLVRGGTYALGGRWVSGKHLWGISKASALATLVVLGMLFSVHITDWLSRSLFFSFALASPVALYWGRLASVRFLHRAATWNILVVGKREEATTLMAENAPNKWDHIIVGTVAPDQLHDLEPMLLQHSVDQVFVTASAWTPAVLRQVADTCEEVGVRLSMDANFVGLRTAKAQLEDLDGSTVLTFSSTPTDTDALVIKRAMDVVLSVLLLLFLSPLLAVVTLSIRIIDGGPVLYHQVRVGLYGRRFPMPKFRTMVVGADAQRSALAMANEMSGPVFKMRNDPRVTTVGRFLRRTSIDELPQLFSVLTGQMSLVGPRPPIPEEVESYQRWQLRRLSMKPGLTCTWQVSGRNRVDFETWMQLDLQYIDNWSLFLDLKLLAKTIPAVIWGTGAH